MSEAAGSRVDGQGAGGRIVVLDGLTLLPANTGGDDADLSQGDMVYTVVQRALKACTAIGAPVRIKTSI